MGGVGHGGEKQKKKRCVREGKMEKKEIGIEDESVGQVKRGK